MFLTVSYSQDGLELLTLLLLPLNCYFKRASRYLVYVALRIKPRASHVLGKHSTNSYILSMGVAFGA